MKKIGKFFSSIMSWFVRITMMPLMLIGFRPKFHYEDKAVQGRKIKGAAMIIANHTHIFDPPMIYTVFPSAGVRMIAGELLYDRAMLRWILKQCRAIKIDRTKMVDMQCMREVQQTLAGGTPVGLFPEGTTVGKSKDELLPFQSGSALFALRAGVPVIPVFTSGEYEIFGKRLHILIGKPIEFDDKSLTPDNIQKQTDMLYLKMKELQADLQSRMNKN